MAKKTGQKETAVVEEAKQPEKVEKATPTVFRFDDQKKLVETLIGIQVAPDNAVIRYRVTTAAPADQFTAQINDGVVEIHPNNVRGFLPCAPSFHYEAI